MDMTNCRIAEEIDLSAIAHNFRLIRSIMGKSVSVMAVVKANAYGLGVLPVAETLKNAGCAGFCVSCWAEAEPLLRFGMPIQLLGGVFDYELVQAVRHGAILGITDLETAKRYSAEAARQGKTLECHFKLDTGMGRLGILYRDAPEIIRECVKLPNLACKGIYSHFPKAYDGDSSFAAEQVRRFLGVIEASGVKFEKIHMANSDAVTAFGRTHEPPFNYARAGIVMYGPFSKSAAEQGFKPAVSLYSRLVSARMMPAGWSIGYERTRILEKDTLVGTVSAGYADGLPLALTNRGFALFHGKRCPVIGRISMDYTTIELDGFSPEECRPGDTVTFIGRDGEAEIPATEWAELKNTHVYDIFCSVSPRVPRFHR